MVAERDATIQERDAELEDIKEKPKTSNQTLRQQKRELEQEVRCLQECLVREEHHAEKKFEEMQKEAYAQEAKYLLELRWEISEERNILQVQQELGTEEELKRQKASTAVKDLRKIVAEMNDEFKDVVEPATQKQLRLDRFLDKVESRFEQRFEEAHKRTMERYNTLHAKKVAAVKINYAWVQVLLDKLCALDFYNGVSRRELCEEYIRESSDADAEAVDKNGRKPFDVEALRKRPHLGRDIDALGDEVFSQGYAMCALDYAKIAYLEASQGKILEGEDDENWAYLLDPSQSKHPVSRGQFAGYYSGMSLFYEVLGRRD